MVLRSVRYLFVPSSSQLSTHARHQANTSPYQVRSLALEYRNSALARSTSATTPFLIYLTSRNHDRGERALSELQTNDQALQDAAVLTRDGGNVELRYKQLDVGEDDSILDFVNFLHAEHKEGMDILVNNAGVALDADGFSTSHRPAIRSCSPSSLSSLILSTAPDNVATTLRTNYHAPLTLSLRLLSLLRLSSTPSTPSRITNLSSLLSKLSTPKYSPRIIAAFRAAVAAGSIADVTDLMAGFEDAVAIEAAHQGEERAKVEGQGWPRSAYAVSKAGVTAVSVILGREELRKAGRGKRGDAEGGAVLVNACCPGFVSTDMTNNRGRKTAERGAQTPVKLALGDLRGSGGEFWERGEVSVWDTAGELEDVS